MQIDTDDANADCRLRQNADFNSTSGALTTTNGRNGCVDAAAALALMAEVGPRFPVDDGGLAQFETAISVVIPVIFGLIAVLGFVGNMLVIVVVTASNRKRRSTTNVLVTGLAVADLVFILVCVPFTAVNYALTVWPFGTTWCKVGRASQ